MAVINRNLFSVLFQAFPGGKLFSGVLFYMYSQEAERDKHVSDPGTMPFQGI